MMEKLNKNIFDLHKDILDERSYAILNIEIKKQKPTKLQKTKRTA